MDLENRVFDYCIFSDSYAVIPNVNNMLRHCERFLNDNGYMVVTSTLFDDYNSKIDLVKQNLKYISTVEYGRMVLKSELEEYIVNERKCTDFEFRLIKQHDVLGYEFKSYIVMWKIN